MFTCRNKPQSKVPTAFQGACAVNGTTGEDTGEGSINRQAEEGTSLALKRTQFYRRKHATCALLYYFSACPFV